MEHRGKRPDKEAREKIQQKLQLVEQQTGDVQAVVAQIVHEILKPVEDAKSLLQQKSRKKFLAGYPLVNQSLEGCLDKLLLLRNALTLAESTESSGEKSSEEEEDIDVDEGVSEYSTFTTASAYSRIEQWNAQSKSVCMMNSTEVTDGEERQAEHITPSNATIDAIAGESVFMEGVEKLETVEENIVEDEVISEQCALTDINNLDSEKSILLPDFTNLDHTRDLQERIPEVPTFVNLDCMQNVQNNTSSDTHLMNRLDEIPENAKDLVSTSGAQVLNHSDETSENTKHLAPTSDAQVLNHSDETLENMKDSAAASDTQMLNRLDETAENAKGVTSSGDTQMLNHSDETLENAKDVASTGEIQVLNHLDETSENTKHLAATSDTQMLNHLDETSENTKHLAVLNKLDETSENAKELAATSDTQVLDQLDETSENRKDLAATSDTKVLNSSDETSENSKYLAATSDIQVLNHSNETSDNTKDLVSTSDTQVMNHLDEMPENAKDVASTGDTKVLERLDEMSENVKDLEDSQDVQNSASDKTHAMDLSDKASRQEMEGTLIKASPDLVACIGEASAQDSSKNAKRDKKKIIDSRVSKSDSVNASMDTQPKKKQKASTKSLQSKSIGVQKEAKKQIPCIKAKPLTSCSTPLPYPWKSNVPLKVIVTEVINPWDLYIQPANSDYDEMMEEMCLHFAKETSRGYKGGINHVPEIGAMCCARSPVDKIWYRAKVQEVKQLEAPCAGKENDSDSQMSLDDPQLSCIEVTVFFIDDGTTAAVPLNHLRPLEEQFCELPCQSIHCMLAGVAPHPVPSRTDLNIGELVSKWDQEATEWLSVMVKSEQFWTAYLSANVWVDKLYYMVDLYTSDECMTDVQEEGLPPVEQNLGFMMLQVNMASYCHWIPSILQRFKSEIQELIGDCGMQEIKEERRDLSRKGRDKFPENNTRAGSNSKTWHRKESSRQEKATESPDLSVIKFTYKNRFKFPLLHSDEDDGYVEAAVFHIIDPSLFYVQPVGPNVAELDGLISDLQQIYKNMKEPPGLIHGKLGVDSAVVARCTKDSLWCRGIVTKVRDTGSALNYLVYHIDYGREQWTPVKDIRPVAETMFDIPAGVVACCLAGIKPVTSDSTNTDKKYTQKKKKNRIGSDEDVTTTTLNRAAGDEESPIRFRSDGAQMLDSWGVDATAAFKELVKGQILFLGNEEDNEKQLKDSTGYCHERKTYYVYLYDTNGETDRVINDVLVSMGFAVYSRQRTQTGSGTEAPGKVKNSCISKDSHQRPSSSLSSMDFTYTNKFKWKPLLSCDGSDYVQIVVSTVVNPYLFYVHLVTPDVAMFEGLMEKIQQIYTADKQAPNASGKDLNVGSAVVAKYSKDDTWCRGIIIQKNFEGSALVYLVFHVDFGSKQWTSINNIRPVAGDLFATPVGVLPCRLAGIEPRKADKKRKSKARRTSSDETSLAISALDRAAGDDDCFGLLDYSTSEPDTVLWPKEATEAFEKLVLKDQSLYASCQGKDKSHQDENGPYRYDKEPYDVILIDTNGDNDVNINDELVAKCVAKHSVAPEKTDAETMKSEEQPSSKTSDSSRGVSPLKIEEAKLQQTKESKEDVSDNLKYSPISPLSPSAVLDIWNPMAQEFLSSQNTYKVDADDPGVMTMGYKEPTRNICKYFLSKRGCYRGINCIYEHSRPEDPPDMLVEVLCEKLSDIVEMPDPGQWVLIQITSFFDPTHFWARFPLGTKSVEEIVSEVDGFTEAVINEADQLDSLQAKLNKRYSSMPFQNKDLIMYADGELLAAKYSKDGNWYRAKVVDIVSTGKNVKLKVFFVDYGNMEIVHEDDTRVLEAEFLNLDFQAVECFLMNSVLRDDIKTDKLKLEYANNLFDELVQEKILAARVMSRAVNKTLVLDLYDSFGKQHVCIRDRLVEAGILDTGWNAKASPWDMSKAIALNPNVVHMLPG